MKVDKRVGSIFCGRLGFICWFEFNYHLNLACNILIVKGSSIFFFASILINFIFLGIYEYLDLLLHIYL